MMRNPSLRSPADGRTSRNQGALDVLLAGTCVQFVGLAAFVSPERVMRRHGRVAPESHLGVTPDVLPEASDAGRAGTKRASGVTRASSRRHVSVT